MILPIYIWSNQYLKSLGEASTNVELWHLQLGINLSIKDQITLVLNRLSSTNSARFKFSWVFRNFNWFAALVRILNWVYLQQGCLLDVKWSLAGMFLGWKQEWTIRPIWNSMMNPIFLVIQCWILFLMYISASWTFTADLWIDNTLVCFWPHA